MCQVKRLCCALCPGSCSLINVGNMMYGIAVLWIVKFMQPVSLSGTVNCI